MASPARAARPRLSRCHCGTRGMGVNLWGESLLYACPVAAQLCRNARVSFISAAGFKAKHTLESVSG